MPPNFLTLQQKWSPNGVTAKKAICRLLMKGTPRALFGVLGEKHVWMKRDISKPNFIIISL